MRVLACAVGKSLQKNGNRCYYHSVPRTVRFLFGQSLIEVSGIIECIDNREYESGTERPCQVSSSHLNKTAPSSN